MTINPVEKIYWLLMIDLILDCPVLSGNMKSFVKTTGFGQIEIDAPFYDMTRWKKDKTIVHTGETINGRTAYAEWVNRLGAFATHNKSEKWVNRVVLDVCEAVANEIGAKVVCEL